MKPRKQPGSNLIIERHLKDIDHRQERELAELKGQLIELAKKCLKILPDEKDQNREKLALFIEKVEAADISKINPEDYLLELNQIINVIKKKFLSLQQKLSTEQKSLLVFHPDVNEFLLQERGLSVPTSDYFLAEDVSVEFRTALNRYNSIKYEIDTSKRVLSSLTEIEDALKISQKTIAELPHVLTRKAIKRKAFWPSRERSAAKDLKALLEKFKLSHEVESKIISQELQLRHYQQKDFFTKQKIEIETSLKILIDIINDKLSDIHVGFRNQFQELMRQPFIDKLRREAKEEKARHGENINRLLTRIENSSNEIDQLRLFDKIKVLEDCRAIDWVVSALVDEIKDLLPDAKRHEARLLVLQQELKNESVQLQARIDDYQSYPKKDEELERRILEPAIKLQERLKEIDEQIKIVLSPVRIWATPDEMSDIFDQEESGDSEGEGASRRLSDR